MGAPLIANTAGRYCDCKWCDGGSRASLRFHLSSVRGDGVKLISHRCIFTLSPRTAALQIHRGSNRIPGPPLPRGLISNPGAGMKDIFFLMEREYILPAGFLTCATHSPSRPPPLTPPVAASAPLVKASVASQTRLQPSVCACVQPQLSEGDCRLFLFLWPLACVAVFEHAPPTPVCSAALCQTQARWSQGCRFASPLSTSLAAAASPA